MSQLTVRIRYHPWFGLSLKAVALICWLVGTVPSASVCRFLIRVGARFDVVPG